MTTAPPDAPTVRVSAVGADLYLLVADARQQAAAFFQVDQHEIEWEPIEASATGYTQMSGDPTSRRVEGWEAEVTCWVRPAAGMDP